MVSFEMSDEQKMVVETVRKFALKELRPLAHECDEHGEVPASLQEKAWEMGLLFNIIPEEYGGGGGGHSAVTGALVAEEMAYGDLSMAIHALSPALVAVPIMEGGTGPQKKELLPLYAGEKFRPSAAALIEPRFDFEWNSLQTTAVREGETYVLTGRKCLVPLAAQAENVLVYAALEGRTEAFLIPAGTPGLSLTEREKNMGIKALATYELALDRCRVPAGNRLGGEQGVDIPRLLNFHNVACAAMAVGVAKASFEYARDYAKERVAFGEPIASRQAIAFMLAEMAIEVDAARLLMWEAAWLLDKGMETTREASLAKMYAADMALAVTDRGVQTLGGHGYIREHPVELWLRNGRGFYTFGAMAIV
jgi:acyl-CoA dehydrogenase